MRNIWFERRMPTQYESMLNGFAVATGAGDQAETDPYYAVENALAVVAGGLDYGAAFMDRAPQVLVVSRVGIGYDKVDVAEATVRGIAVCNTPDGPTISTAEMAISLMMAVARNLKKVEKDMRRALENDVPIGTYGEYAALELYGMRLGLIGLGRIGGHVARIAQAISMQVSAYDPHIGPERASALGVKLENSIEAVLREADVVSLHLPLTTETYHVMNVERFAQMKQGAIFINVARGGHVDENALLAALEDGRLFGAGLDVTDPEPPLKDNPLLYRDDVIVTPHIASGTYAGRNRMYVGAIEQVLQVLRGERPPNLVNPEVWPRVLERLNI